MIGYDPDWKPQAETLRLLALVGNVLAELEPFWPLTLRQVFYRLVAEHGYPKSEAKATKLNEMIARARRAGRVPWQAIRDDGALFRAPRSYAGVADALGQASSIANTYRLDRQEGQPHYIEVWAEAAGMIPQLRRVADTYGIPVVSGGGFGSLTLKYEAAQRLADEVDPVVLIVGDLDPSGVVNKANAEADVNALAGVAIRFIDVAATVEQVDRLGLPTQPLKPAKPKDMHRRAVAWRSLGIDYTVQAEALSPPELAAELQAAILTFVENDARTDLLAREAADRGVLRDYFNKEMP